MQPKKKSDTQLKMYKTLLEDLCNPRHSLKLLADKIDWTMFEERLGLEYAEKGRPGLSTRLMVGIHYLKHTFNYSDEDAHEMFHENPYWQYFCGLEYFTHETKFDRSSMTRWRKRMGSNKLEKLLSESFAVALRSKVVKASEVKKVVVDTTVQEKAIAFPTDSRLYYKGLRTLVRMAKGLKIKLRQSYVRVSKHALFKVGRYRHANQGKRARKMQRKLRTYFGRVIRDIDRKLDTVSPSKQVDQLKVILERCKQVHAQKRTDKNKIYSIHAPEVECIAKGKAHKKYEFGCKASLVTTHKSCWVVGAQAVHGNPFDGHTLKDQIEQVKRLTQLKPEKAFVDNGYRGKKHHPQGMETIVCGKKTKNRVLRKQMKRRSSIEPIIGHVKSDNRMNRNYLKGIEGDKINVLLAASGKNILKMLNILKQQANDFLRPLFFKPFFSNLFKITTF